ncbi:MAG: tetratricopeptide repeat protein [Planctomycetes bacterium]|nr:tetratricopeptide repeat protein [Planctomycetota bacterium]
MTSSVDPSARASRVRLVTAFPDAWVRPLVERLGAGAPPSVVLLAGPDHLGRRELVDEAVARANAAGRSARVARLDLVGYEPDRNTFGQWVAFRLAQSVPDEEARTARMQRMQQVCGQVEPTAHVATLLSVLCDRPEALDDPASWRGDPPQPLFGKQRKDVEVLSALLTSLSSDGPLVLHVPDDVQLSDTFRRWLVDFANGRADVVLVLSCAADAADDETAPGAGSVLRLDLAPLDAAAQRAALQPQFVDGALGDGFAAAFFTSTRGWPLAAAERLEQLIDAGVLTVEDGRLAPAGDGLESEAAAAVLEADPLQPLRDMLAELPEARAGMVQEYLTLASLLGAHVPSDLLIEFMKLTVQQRDELIDAIDDGLVDDPDVALLVDHEYGHPAVPGLSTYAFARRTLARAILEEVSADERRRRATELLDHFQNKLPLISRGVARLFVSLTAHAGDAERALPFRRALQWWSGREDAPALTQSLVDAQVAGSVDADALWDTLTSRTIPWPAWRRLALLDAFAQQPGGVPDERRGDVPFVRANLVLESNDLRAAKVAAAEAYEVRKTTHGEESEQAVAALSLLGVIQRELGELEPAREALASVLERAAELWGAHDTQTASAHHNLAAVLRLQGRLDEARSHLESCLAIDRADSEGPPNARMGMTLHDLALVQTQKGEHDEALANIEQAVILTRDLHGANSSRMGVVLGTQMRLLAAAGKKPEALEAGKRMLDIQAATLGAGSPQVAQSLSTVAGLQLETGDADAAEKSILHAMQLNERIFGKQHPAVAGNLTNLGWILRQQGKLKEAESKLREALAMLEAMRGANHPDVATGLNNLAGILEAKGDLDGARDTLRKALGIVEISLGPRHARVAMALTNLAHVLKRQGQTKEAKARLERALTIAQAAEEGGGQLTTIVTKALAEMAV